uniref:SRCR domain-containing protein n=1 Tax=Trichuris muris TaxID=70415 RepID=A0A5S6Q8H7_TRIMR
MPGRFCKGKSIPPWKTLQADNNVGCSYQGGMTANVSQCEGMSLSMSCTFNTIGAVGIPGLPAPSRGTLVYPSQRVRKKRPNK